MSPKHWTSASRRSLLAAGLAAPLAATVGASPVQAAPSRASTRPWRGPATTGAIPKSVFKGRHR